MSKIFGTLSSDVLAFLGMTIAALLGYFGVRGSRAAPQQIALNGAFQALVQDLQEERGQLRARVSELELQAQNLEGENRNLRQYNESLLRLLSASGIEFLPQRDHHREIS